MNPQINALTPPLWLQLQSTSAAVAAVMQGQSLNAALEHVPARLRPGVQALSFAALRQWGKAQALREQLVSRKPAPALDALLCVSLGLLVSEAASYDAHTLVNQAVEAAKKTAGLGKSANFLNACLRRFLRETDALVSQTLRSRPAAAECAAIWNYPAWWIKRLQQDQPEQWQAVLQAGLDKAPLCLRVNAAQTSVQAYQQALQAAGFAAQQGCDNDGDTASHALLLEQAVGVLRLPGFLQGQVSVQDLAAQWAAPLLLGATQQMHGSGVAGTPWRVLDACAAPGGKTAHLLEWAHAHGQSLALTALEIDPGRCARIIENLERLKLNQSMHPVLILAADAGKPSDWWDGQAFDAILLDAPCSASGIVRRHPDIPWLRRETDIAQLADIQDRLLSALWPLLKKGGHLLYCTCSVFNAEGQDRVQAFLKRNTSAELRSSPGHVLPSAQVFSPHILDNQALNHDGFYYALLYKN
jgi:16S rRNA (cytosine967-C5)-methyltransferase